MELNRNSWYPDFDVMKEKEEWDKHTRSIVENRLQPQNSYSFLTNEEVLNVRAICSRLLYDSRQDIITFVVSHFDQTCSSDIGEAQREVGVPAQRTLIRDGLRYIDNIAEQLFAQKFNELDGSEQDKVLAQLEKGQAPSLSIHNGTEFPQKPLFKKLLSTAVSAYYSHPTIWSEIGYAGPAYPRGYVRSEYGLTDPWEAKRDES